MRFYDLFIENFNKCDTNKENSLNESEMKECLKDEKGPFKNMHQIAESEDSLN